MRRYVGGQKRDIRLQDVEQRKTLHIDLRWQNHQSFLGMGYEEIDHLKTIPGVIYLHGGYTYGVIASAHVTVSLDISIGPTIAICRPDNNCFGTSKMDLIKRLNPFRELIFP